MKATRMLARGAGKGLPNLTWLAIAVLLLILAAGGALAQQGGDPARGAQLFDENCAVCHGPDGKGRAGAQLSSVFSSIQPDLFVGNIIANGIAGTAMPAWQEPNGPLTVQDVEDLTAFVLTLSGGRPNEFPTPELKPVTPIPTLADVAGDPTAGSVVFAQNCAMCHGDKGQGRAGADLSRAFASIRPDLTVRNTVATGIAGTAMPAWAMANGGPLTDDEIDNVTAFVLTLPQETTSEPQPGTTPTTTTPAQPGFYLPVWAVVVLVAVLLLLAVAVIFFARAR